MPATRILFPDARLKFPVSFVREFGRMSLKLMLLGFPIRQKWEISTGESVA
jgi:hypothetical protein